MKLIYRIIIFLIAFQFAALIISSLGIFPTSLYSDVQFSEFADLSWEEQLVYFFTPEGGAEVLGIPISDFTIGAIILMMTAGGVVIGFATRNVAIISAVIVGTFFVPMLTKSINFFSVMFNTWDTPALTYLGVSIGLGIIVIVVITLVEMTTHGRSG